MTLRYLRSELCASHLLTMQVVRLITPGKFRVNQLLFLLQMIEYIAIIVNVSALQETTFFK